MEAGATLAGCAADAGASLAEGDAGAGATLADGDTVAGTALVDGDGEEDAGAALADGDAGAGSRLVDGDAGTGAVLADDDVDAAAALGDGAADAGINAAALVEGDAGAARKGSGTTESNRGVKWLEGVGESAAGAVGGPEAEADPVRAGLPDKPGEATAGMVANSSRAVCTTARRLSSAKDATARRVHSRRGLVMARGGGRRQEAQQLSSCSNTAKRLLSRVLAGGELLRAFGHVFVCTCVRVHDGTVGAGGRGKGCHANLRGLACGVR